MAPEPTVRRVLIRADGAARGNPGPASAGAVLIDADRPGAELPLATPLAVIARPLGSQTNNFAEWTAVVLALGRAKELGAEYVELVLDSKLVVEQLMGRWKVKEPTLARLHGQARALLSTFKGWNARHEGRANNTAADSFANMALDDPIAARLAEAGGFERAATAAAASIGPEAWICVTCGVQYPASDEPPVECPICLDERQYVGWDGQRWTTMARLAAAGHRNALTEEEPGLWSLGTEPKVAIGQRALLIQTPAGNVMWDCITYVDDETVARVGALGGIAAIAISHPHFYSAMSTWSAAFGNSPVYIHAADGEWVQYPGPGLTLWETDAREILPGITLINTRGHFAGSTVLHWAAGAGGRGALLTGDSITVVSDRRWVSFMYSYPNLIPLPDDDVRHIVDVLRPYRYERVYSLWEGRVTASDGHAAVERSAERYLRFRNGA
ncbi:MAG: reverse transcriptase-like protein [Candidatus Limnocylindrales bacterium]